MTIERVSYRIDTARAVYQSLPKMMSASTQEPSVCACSFLSPASLGHSKSPETIYSLPPELLCEIFIHLNTQGLYSVKLIVLQSHQFWQQVLYSVGPISRQHDFSKKLSTCSLQQVEHWATQSLRIYERWALDVPLAFRSHVFEYSTTAGMSQYKLLPGGRWLLTSNWKGQYLLYDLHLPSRPQELASPGRHDHENGTMDHLFSLKIWVDSSKEHLCFRFVVWRCTGPEKRGYVTRTIIYETNVFENGGTFSFVMKTIYSARSYLSYRRPSVALSDKYLIETRVTGRDHDNTKRWKLALIEYNTDDPGLNDKGQYTCSECFFMPSTIPALITVPQKYVFVTTNGLVVAFGPGFISLYSIQDLKTRHKQRVLPLHRVEMASCNNIFGPFHDRGFDWMIALYHVEFLLIRLPRDSSSPPRVVTLGRNPVETGNVWFPGLVRGDAALALYHDWTAKVITYSWDVEMTKCVFRMKDVHIPKVAEHLTELTNIGLDMASGRVVFIDGRTNCTVLVLDT